MMILNVEVKSEVTLKKWSKNCGLWRIRLYVPGTNDRWTVWQVKVWSWTFGFSPAKYDSIWTYPFRRFMGDE